MGRCGIAALKHPVEGEHFVAEYPDAAESEADFVDRLGAALAPTFRAAEPPGREDGEDVHHMRWPEPRIREHRELLHRTDMRAVQERMCADGVPPIAAVVITRELLVPGRHILQDARDTVLGGPARLHRRTGARLDQEFERLQETAVRNAPTRRTAPRTRGEHHVTPARNQFPGIPDALCALRYSSRHTGRSGGATTCRNGNARGGPPSWADTIDGEDPSCTSARTR